MCVRIITFLKITMLYFVVLHLVTYVSAIALKFESINSDVFPVESGIIAAFGHFNHDEYTDVFALQQGGRKLQIFLGPEAGQQFQPNTNCTFRSIITSVVPGDFNGDSIMDVLITLISESDPSLHDVKILWGKDGDLDCKAKTVFSIINQPFVVDYNGDMIPDIIAESSDETYVWFSSTEKTFIPLPLNNSQKFRNPHSSGLIDVNNDLAADILIMGENHIEIGINSGGKFNFSKKNIIDYPSNPPNLIKLQSTFVDLNLDAKLDIIMPACYDIDCKSSVIFLYNKTLQTWVSLLDNFKHEGVTWGFKLKPQSSPLDMAALPVTLRAGDIDMDGFPDFLTILESKTTKRKTRPVIIKNSPCFNCTNCMRDRCLEIYWNIPGLQDIPNIEIAAFFDIFEDGVLDILASSKDHEWKIHALKNSENLDSCFMKVLILGGLCKNCSGGHKPYGVNQPGPIVQYHMTTQEGRPLVSCAIQIPQTAFFSLQLPYTVFGLGQTPNFIDGLTVAVPAKFNNSVHKREWTQIIPNSQIVVIPHPPQDERRWVKKLFVTPSHYVVLTCIALIGTCTFISIIVAVLHWREKKEDKKEKKQDAHRFHFDAM